jgi:flagellar hook-associated protein 1
MGLTSALNSATSGLQVNQTAIGIVSQNIANADTVGYSRRRVQGAEIVTGGEGSGVRVARIERMLNEVAQKQLRLETAGSAYTSLKSQFASELDRLFGKPGGDGSLDTALNEFTKTLQSLASDPASQSARAKVLGDATGLVQRLSSVSEGVQLLRSEAEGRLGSAVVRANELLRSIADINVKVVQASQNPTGTNPALLDQRDTAINELSQLLDVQVIKGDTGSVSLFTNAGVTLFDGINPVKLSFDGRSSLLPQSQYSTDPNLRGVGTITATSVTGHTSDLLVLKGIRSGEIMAAVELRDQSLVQAQRQLDELAAGLSRALSDKQVSGTDVTVSGNPGKEIDLTGLQAGNAVTVDFTTGSGAARRIVLIPTLGSAPATIPASDTNDPNAIVIPFNISGGIGAAAGAIQTALSAQGVTLTVASPSANRLQFVNAGGNSVTAANAGVTVTTFNSGNVQAPIFVDSGNGNTPFTGSFENGSQLVGIAQRLAVNPALVTTPANLVVYGSGISQGDTTRPQFLFDALTQSKRNFAASSGVDGLGVSLNTNVADFGRRVVEAQGANAEAMKRLDAGQKVALASVESRFAETSGVSIDQELSQLVQLQTAYTANARMMTAVKELMDVLLRI